MKKWVLLNVRHILANPQTSTPNYTHGALTIHYQLPGPSPASGVIIAQWYHAFSKATSTTPYQHQNNQRRTEFRPINYKNSCIQLLLLEHS
jgi:hypothetical protein